MKQEDVGCHGPDDKACYPSPVDCLSLKGKKCSAST